MKTVIKSFLFVVSLFSCLCVTTPSLMALPSTFDSTFTVNLTFPSKVDNVFDYAVIDPSNSFTNGILTFKRHVHLNFPTSRSYGTSSSSSEGLDTTFSLLNLSDRTFSDIHFTGNYSYDGTVDLTGFDLSLYGEYGGMISSDTRRFFLTPHRQSFGFRYDKNTVETFHRTGTVDIMFNMPANSRYDMWVTATNSVWAAPEPATLLLFGLGLGLVPLAGVRMKMRK